MVQFPSLLFTAYLDAFSPKKPGKNSRVFKLKCYKKHGDQLIAGHQLVPQSINCLREGGVSRIVADYHARLIQGTLLSKVPVKIFYIPVCVNKFESIGIYL
jgi:hypothetical protein